MNKQWTCWRLALPLAVFFPAVPGMCATPTLAIPTMELLEVRQIWDRGDHCAFTDLIRWKGRWWCTFRESAAHIGGDGNIRLLASDNGENWISAALISEKDIDLRDPKLSITPDDRLMINCGGSVYLGSRQLKGRRSRVFFSADGQNWTSAQPILGEGEWLWRVTWQDGIAYGVAFTEVVAPDQPANSQGAEWPLNLYSSHDGVKWALVGHMNVPGKPNETTLRFLPTGELIAMIRRDGGNLKGMIGVSAAPYRQWTWHETDYRFGGPNFISAPGGQWLAGTRGYPVTDSAQRADVTHRKVRSTVIFLLSTDGVMIPLITLPGGGDSSYPGFAWNEDQLWVTYYSSHTGKAAIYFAKLRIKHSPP